MPMDCDKVLGRRLHRPGHLEEGVMKRSRVLTIRRWLPAEGSHICSMTRRGNEWDYRWDYRWVKRNWGITLCPGQEKKIRITEVK